MMPPTPDFPSKGDRMSDDDVALLELTRSLESAVGADALGIVISSLPIADLINVRAVARSWRPKVRLPLCAAREERLHLARLADRMNRVDDHVDFMRELIIIACLLKCDLTEEELMLFRVAMEVQGQALTNAEYKVRILLRRYRSESDALGMRFLHTVQQNLVAHCRRMIHLIASGPSCTMGLSRVPSDPRRKVAYLQLHACNLHALLRHGPEACWGQTARELDRVHASLCRLVSTLRLPVDPVILSSAFTHATYLCEPRRVETRSAALARHAYEAALDSFDRLVYSEHHEEALLYLRCLQELRDLQFHPRSALLRHDMLRPEDEAVE